MTFILRCGTWTTHLSQYALRYVIPKCAFPNSLTLGGVTPDFTAEWNHNFFDCMHIVHSSISYSTIQFFDTIWSVSMCMFCWPPSIRYLHCRSLLLIITNNIQNKHDSVAKFTSLKHHHFIFNKEQQIWSKKALCFISVITLQD